MRESNAVEVATESRQGTAIASGTASTALGAAAGLAPHVLHHVGLVAGVAFFAGATGTAFFGVVGMALAIPLLLRLRRRYGTWLVPGIALLVMTAMFGLSALVIGPMISGG